MQNTTLASIQEKINIESHELCTFAKQLYRSGIISLDGRSKLADDPQSVDSSLSLLVLKITDKCNLSCKYCYNEGDYGAIEMEIATRSIDSALEACHEGVSLILHGGEPFLEFQKIQQIINYAELRARELSKNVFISIQTNATLLSNTQIEFIKQHSIGIGVSFDGVKDVNDRLRIWHNNTGSSEQILRGIELLKKHGLSVNILAVVTTLNSGRLSEIALNLQQLGCKSVKFSYFFPQGKAAMCKELAPDPRDIIHSLKCIISMIETGEISAIEVHDILLLIDNIVIHGKGGPNMCQRSPCGAARDMITVFPSGKIYACDCLAHPNFELGNIKDTSLAECARSEKAVQLSNRVTEHLSPCFSCPVRKICGGTMTCRAFWSNETVNSIDHNECVINKDLIGHLMWRLTESQMLVDYYTKWRQSVYGSSELECKKEYR